MMRETELFFDSLVREDRSLLDLITADYTFVNERLARHYGIPNITGTDFQRVTVPEYRRGILGHGSVLVQTSVADRTSPVMRGKWVMEVLLGSPPPAPPPNIPALEDTGAASGTRILTVRERMEQHRKNPACMSCHRVIDPLGLTLENFDVTGKYRIKDSGNPVDANGVLYDGTEMEGPAGLKAALIEEQARVRAQLHRELHDLRAGAPRRAHRHADHSAHRARGREAGLPAVVVRAGRGDEPRLPDEYAAAGRDHRGGLCRTSRPCSSCPTSGA